MNLKKTIIIPSVVSLVVSGAYTGPVNASDIAKPNIIYIMADDHAAHAISAYGSVINTTPNIDRIANEGIIFNNTFCTNAICTPSRATILTGKYSHINGVKNLQQKLDGTQMTFPQELQKAGYQTAIVGKWHLGHGGTSDPTGFDYWNVLPGQGAYNDPKMIEMGKQKKYNGYATDVITDISLDWLNNRDKEKPFMLLLHHKAPHRPWVPDEKHADMYNDVEIPLPETFNDDYSNRGAAAFLATMRIESNMNQKDLKMPEPEGLSPQESKEWKYQRYIKDYLRCVASVDDNVGRVLDWLDKEGLAKNTIVVYTSDQGMFLGDHGWYDKRFMYEQSLKMPLMIRYPAEIAYGSKSDDFVLNTDFAPSIMDFAGVTIPDDIQGRSIRPLTKGERPADWRTSMYYRYWMVDVQTHAAPHFGVRTDKYKLIYYYRSGARKPEKGFKPHWELFDLENDPNEMNNLYNDPAYAEQVKTLKDELYKLKAEAKDFDDGNSTSDSTEDIGGEE